jgi:multidrug efflux pump subunit AcrA (membrane-fusion protein)
MLDVSLQAPRTEAARIEAESTARTEVSRVQLEYTRDELERLTHLTEVTAASPRETREARFNLETAKLNHEIREQEHAQAVETYRLQREMLKQHELLAPFSGCVTARLKQVGETVKELEGVIELCQLDTLLVTVDCPLGVYKLLRIGDRVTVTPTDVRWPSKSGAVTAVIPVADASSQTFKAKLSVANTDGSWIGGLMVAVDFGTRTPGPDAPSASGFPSASQPAMAAGR